MPHKYVIPDARVTPMLRQFAAIPHKTLAVGAMVIGNDRSKDAVVESPRMPTNLGESAEFPAVLELSSVPVPTANYQPMKDDAGNPTGMMQGWPIANPLPNSWRGSTVFADVLNRLAGNLQLAPDARRFQLKYAGKTITNISGFVAALQADGYTFSTRVETRVANFSGMNVQTPDGKLHPVAFPTFAAVSSIASVTESYDYVPTVSKNGELVALSGEEEKAWRVAHDSMTVDTLYLPAVHAEWIVSFQKGSSQYDVKWFYGTDGIGFRPYGIAVPDSWAGTNAVPPGWIAEAGIGKILVLAGYYSEAFARNTLAKGYTHKGYGTNATCADSVSALMKIAAQLVNRPQFFHFSRFVDGITIDRKDFWVGFPRAISVGKEAGPAKGGDVKLQANEPVLAEMLPLISDTYSNAEFNNTLSAIGGRWSASSTLLSMPWKNLADTPYDAVECTIRQASRSCPGDTTITKALSPADPSELCNDFNKAFGL